MNIVSLATSVAIIIFVFIFVPIGWKKEGSTDVKTNSHMRVTYTLG